MKDYNPFEEECPSRIAHFDGNTYECWNIKCWAKKAELYECGRMINHDEISYTPLLRCKECGTVYFGLPTQDTEEIEAYHEHAENVKKELAELAQADDKASIEEIKAAQKKEAEILRSEAEKHQAEIDGDIILPNMLTF